MAPKEKAIELYDKFFYAIPSMSDEGQIEHKTAKQCAKIMVDEILSNPLFFPDYGELYFWQSVKKEIEKL